MARSVDFAKLTLQDALDLAILVEAEAQERYVEFSKMTGVGYEGDAADVFRAMADNEAKHARQLTERRKALFGDVPRRIEPEMFFDVEAPDYGKPRVYMGPRQAMEVALESEKKAYAFYDEALGHISKADVRKLFTELRDEELTHQKLLEQHMKNVPPGADIDDDAADEPPAL